MASSSRCSSSVVCIVRLRRQERKKKKKEKQKQSSHGPLNPIHACVYIHYKQTDGIKRTGNPIPSPARRPANPIQPSTGPHP